MAVAVVTDAGGSMGSVLVKRLQQEGMRVAALGREVPAGDLAVEIDVTDRAQMTAAADRVNRELGPVSVLVMAPDMQDTAPFGSMSAAQWQRLLTAYLGSTASACAAFVPFMVRARRGTVIMLSSWSALAGVPGEAYRAAASGSVLGFTKSFALEVARHGVRVNCIAAGPTDAVSPEDIADAVVFLVKDGDFFVGQVLSPAGAASV